MSIWWLELVFYPRVWFHLCCIQTKYFFALIFHNSVFHVVSGSGLPSLALPDDLFLPRLETCSHSFFTCVFFVLFLRTALCLTSVSTALLSRHSPKCHITLSLKSPGVITMVKPRQPKNTDLIRLIWVWPWYVSHDCKRILVITSFHGVKFCP